MPTAVAEREVWLCVTCPGLIGEQVSGQQTHIMPNKPKPKIRADVCYVCVPTGVHGVTPRAPFAAAWKQAAAPSGSHLVGRFFCRRAARPRSRRQRPAPRGRLSVGRRGGRGGERRAHRAGALWVRGQPEDSDEHIARVRCDATRRVRREPVGVNRM